MRTVFSTTREVCAIWAAQSQPEARTSANTSCRGDTLRSYGVRIARIVPLVGGPVALVSEHHYSKTTAIVIGQARHEAHERGLPIFEVETFDVDQAGHKTNLARFEARIAETLDHVERALKPGAWRVDADRLIQTAGRYATTFGVRWSYTGRPPSTVRSRKEREAGE